VRHSEAAPTRLSNIRLGWKFSQDKNALAFTYLQIDW
jgi:hypothetical protein